MFLQIIKSFGDGIINNITSTLSTINKIVWIIDKNQRGHPLKYQCFGSAKNFVKVTGRVAKKCVVCESDLGEEDTKYYVLTYVDQAIINSMDFSIFEI